MSTTVKSVLAVLFVAAIAALLAYPTLNSNNGSPATRRVRAVPPNGRAGHDRVKIASFSSPTGSPSPSAATRPGEGLVIKGRTPRACLRQAIRPNGAGEVVAVHGASAEIATLDGRAVGNIPARHGAGFSASGRYLATSQGRLFAATGKHLGRIFDPDPRFSSWAWSPTADCTASVIRGRRGLEIGSPLSTPKLLLSGRFIENFAWAPDGRALVVDAGLLGPGGLHAMHFYLVNLVIGRIQRVAPLSCCTILAGWTPDGRTLLYWTGEGTSAMKDASVLSGLTIHPPRHFFFHGIGPSREGVPDPDFVTTCGNRLIDVLGAGGPNVAGGPDPTVRNKRLAVMDLHGGPRFLTPAGVAYVDPTCPSDGRFIAAVRFEEGATRGQGRLVLLDSNGVPVKDLTSGPLGDETPEWGPSRTGVVFVHAGTLWFIPEGGAARSTGVPSGSSWDWSATPPAGLSS